MKADEKSLFSIISIIFIIVATLFGVKAETIFLVLGIIIAIYYSYDDMSG
jgi:uncharacterized ion transporter superfamily protein YfcC